MICLSKFSKDFSSETTGLISIEFHMQSLDREGGKKVYIFRPAHMTKMDAMPIYGKNLKNVLLHNHQANCLETWYVALREIVL